MSVVCWKLEERFMDCLHLVVLRTFITFSRRIENHCWWQFSLTDDCLLIHLLISVPNFLQTQQIQSRQNWSRARSGKICFCCLREWRPLLLPQISQVRRREMGGSCAQLCFWYFHFRRNYSIRNSWLIASRTWVAFSRSQTQRFTQEINHLN